MERKKVRAPNVPKAAERTRDSARERTRVLVVQSVNDALTARRIERARRNPSLQNYEISDAFLVELNDEDRSVDIEEMMYRVETRVLDPDELFSRLDRRISEQQPAVVIIHGGFVFCRFPDVVAGVIKRLKSRHPPLRFGFEGASGVTSSAQSRVFDQDNEIEHLISHLF